MKNTFIYLVISSIMLLKISNLAAQNRLIRFSQNNKIGLYDDKTKKIIIKPIYTEITPISKGFIAKSTRKYEETPFLLNENSVVIPEFNIKGKDFFEGLLCAQSIDNNTICYLNTEGKIAFSLPKNYQDATDFSEGYAMVKDTNTNKAFIIDKKGQIVFQEIISNYTQNNSVIFAQNFAFFSGRAVLHINNKEKSSFILDINAENSTPKIQSLDKLSKKFHLKEHSFKIHKSGFLVSIASQEDMFDDLETLTMFDKNQKQLLSKHRILAISNEIDGKYVVSTIVETNKYDTNNISNPAFWIDKNGEILSEIPYLGYSRGDLEVIKFENKIILFTVADANHSYKQPEYSIIGFFDEKMRWLEIKDAKADQEKTIIKLVSGETILHYSASPQVYSTREHYERIFMSEYLKNQAGEPITICGRMQVTKLTMKGVDMMVLFEYKNKIGALNHYGKLAVAPEYDEIKGVFYDGYALFAKKNNKWGKINRSNEILMPFEMEETSMDNGFLFSKKNGKWGSENLIPHNYAIKPIEIFRLTEIPENAVYNPEKELERNYTGGFVIKENNKYGLITVRKANKDALPQITQIVPCEYDTITFDEHEKIGFAFKNKQKYIYTNLIKPILAEYDTYRSVLFDRSFDTHKIITKNNKKGVLRLADNKVTIPCEYDNLFNALDQAFLAATKNNKIGFINGENKVILPFEYDTVNLGSFELDNPLFRVSKGDKEFNIIFDGKTLVEKKSKPRNNEKKIMIIEEVPQQPKRKK